MSLPLLASVWSKWEWREVAECCKLSFQNGQI